MGANRVKKYYDNKGKLKPNLKLKREKPKPSRAAKALKILGRSEPVGVEKELAPLYDGKTDKAFLFGAPIPKSLYNKYHDFVGRGFGIAFNCHKAMLGGKVTLHMPKKLTYHEENALIDLDGRVYPTTIATVAEAVAVL